MTDNWFKTLSKLIARYCHPYTTFTCTIHARFYATHVLGVNEIPRKGRDLARSRRTFCQASTFLDGGTR